MTHLINARYELEEVDLYDTDGARFGMLVCEGFATISGDRVGNYEVEDIELVQVEYRGWPHARPTPEPVLGPMAAILRQSIMHPSNAERIRELIREEWRNHSDAEDHGDYLCHRAKEEAF